MEETSRTLGGIYKIIHSYKSRPTTPVSYSDELKSGKISILGAIYVGSPEAMVLSPNIGPSLYEPLMKYCFLFDYDANHPILPHMWGLITQKHNLEPGSHLPPPTPKEAAECFVRACMRGHIHTAQWIYTTYGPFRVSRALYEACHNGHLHIVQWLWEIIKRQNGVWSASYTLSIKACIYGHLHIAKWLKKCVPNIIQRHLSGWYFNQVCKNGYFHMVKWLFEQLDLKDNDGRKPYNNDIDIEWVFCIMCSNGYIHMAQWLLQQKPHINHRICDDHAFRLACARGYLHVAQWLPGSIQPS